MGYMHIANLYKDQRILEFRTCYALEKVHGTSAHVRWKEGALGFSSGGEKHERFVGLFDEEKLTEGFKSLAHEKVVIYGEAYGGKQQGMRDTYGADLCFIAFDVRIGDFWLDVPNAVQVAESLGFEFVPWEKGPAEIEWLDSQKDRPSRVAQLRGMGDDKKSEGVVLRPPFEVTLNNGERVICKHKRDDFSETRTARKVDPEKLQVLEDAKEIALEWITDMRLSHVLDGLPQPHGMEQARDLIRAMIEDVEREGEGEIVMSREANKAIASRTMVLFKARLKESI